MRRGTRARAGTYRYSPAGPGAPLLCIEHVNIFMHIHSHVRVPACASRLGRPGQQRRKEAKKPSRIVAILVLRSVTGQSCYRSYRYSYTPVLLK